MMKEKKRQLENNNNHSDDNDDIALSSRISGSDAPNILDNRIETIRAPLMDLKHISQKYRGKVTFMKRPVDEGDIKILEDICPTKAFDNGNEKHSTAVDIDHGKCIMCGRCKDVSPDFIKMENLFVLPAGEKSQLIESAGNDNSNNNEEGSRSSLAIGRRNGSDHDYSRHIEEIGKELQTKIRGLFGRSLAIRTVNAASCNGCEIEINALLNPIYDIERFGIHFVSSPRHADVLLVTGPISSNMEEPLRLTYNAIPNPKAVIAVGACGCSGGIFAGSYSVIGGVDKIIPVDVYIPGCPPRPQALLEAMLLTVDKLAAMVKG